MFILELIWTVFALIGIFTVAGIIMPSKAETSRMEKLQDLWDNVTGK